MKTESLSTKRQVADYLQLTTRTIDRLMSKGLPHYKIGNQRTRFRISDVQEWLDSQCAVRRLN
jgi:excisionase family DNA binding protein